MIEPRRQHTDNDPFSDKREERALRNFKKVLRELLHLLMKSTRSTTASLYWVNNLRQQFVLESYYSGHKNTTFQDRIDFSQSYLGPYRTINGTVKLEVGHDINENDLDHYYASVPVRYIHVIPFINNGETVALTVLETIESDFTQEDLGAIEAYDNALGHLLYTFIELSELTRDEAQWHQYDEMLNRLNHREEVTYQTDHLLTQLQGFIQQGSVSMLCRSAGEWRVAMNSTHSVNSPLIGTVMQEPSLAADSLRNGESRFAIHFNHAPRRVSLKEPMSVGASFAVPLMMQDRRQAVFVINDENPLVFKESLKHKITNLIRIFGLQLVHTRDGYRLDTDLYCNDTGALQSSMIEKILQREQQRRAIDPDRHTLVSMFTFDEIDEVRTRFGMDQLKSLQHQIVKRHSIDTDKLSSIIGFHTNYVYFAIIQSFNSNIKDLWAELVNEVNANPYKFGDKYQSLTFGQSSLILDKSYTDAHELITRLKRVFSEETKSRQRSSTR